MESRTPPVLITLFCAVIGERTPGANAGHINALFARADRLGITFKTQNQVLQMAAQGLPLDALSSIKVEYRKEKKCDTARSAFSFA